MARLDRKGGVARSGGAGSHLKMALLVCWDNCVSCKFMDLMVVLTQGRILPVSWQHPSATTVCGCARSESARAEGCSLLPRAARQCAIYFPPSQSAGPGRAGCGAGHAEHGARLAAPRAAHQPLAPGAAAADRCRGWQGGHTLLPSSRPYVMPAAGGAACSATRRHMRPVHRGGCDRGGCELGNSVSALPPAAEGAQPGQERRSQLQEEADLEAADGLSATGDASLHADAEVGAAARCPPPGPLASPAWPATR